MVVVNMAVLMNIGTILYSAVSGVKPITTFQQKEHEKEKKSWQE